MCETLCNACAFLSFSDFLHAIVISQILLKLEEHNIISLAPDLCFFLPIVCYGVTWLIIIGVETLIEHKYPELMEMINNFFTEGE